ncbi:uncharacterized protein LOC141665632 [Apium graveolens]|uniref:uncharacterized protein LOC141665632 n=1 Tax=Apium graveolens TaxID=4045 RepID=UPI003D7AA602
MLQQPPRPKPQLPPVVPVVTFKQFQSVKPPKFEGTVDSTKARTSLKEIEKSFALVKVEEDQKTIFASYFLEGETNYWWECRKALEGEDIVTWDRFKELFLEKYFPHYVKNWMEIKFLELKQGNMSVTEYEAKFTKLARFVLEQVDTEEKRAQRFQQGLQPWIRSRVAVFELTTYTAVVQKAMNIGGESERTQKEKGQGNFQNHSNRKPGFQAWTSVCIKANVTCFRCKQKGHYSNECPAGRTEVTYFQCGKKGHVARDCRGPAMAASVLKVLVLPPPPQYNQPRARTFNMTMKEVV